MLRLEKSMAARWSFGDATFSYVHTFNSLVSPDKYFDSHPEYFSMIDGRRVKDHGQLCCH